MNIVRGGGGDVFAGFYCIFIMKCIIQHPHIPGTDGLTAKCKLDS